ALLERVDHAVDGIEPAPAIREGADARQHDAVGARDRVGIVGHHDRPVEPLLTRGALERLRRLVLIAGPVVDDGDGHRCAPASGTSPMTWEADDACDDAGGRWNAGTEDAAVRGGRCSDVSVARPFVVQAS